MSDPSAPFRTATIDCPRCRTVALTSGELRHCTKCKGSWIPTETLAEHVSTMQANVNPKLIWKHEAREALPCAVCRRMMETALLFDVPVDRCEAHGVWFDKDELSESLRRAGTYVEPKPATANDPSTGVVVTEGAGALVVEGAMYGAVELAAEAGGAIVEASPGVLDGILDVFGGIFGAIFDLS
jgi:Zn-finger nucleic acid-binding protein